MENICKEIISELDSEIIFSSVKTDKGNPFIEMDSRFQGLKMPLYNRWQEKMSNLFAEGWSISDLTLLLAAHYAEAGKSFRAKYTLDDLNSSKLVNCSDSEDCYGHNLNWESEGILTVIVSYGINNFSWLKQINPPEVHVEDENGTMFYGVTLNI